MKPRALRPQAAIIPAPITLSPPSRACFWSPRPDPPPPTSSPTEPSKPATCPAGPVGRRRDHVGPHRQLRPPGQPDIVRQRPLHPVDSGQGQYDVHLVRLGQRFERLPGLRGRYVDLEHQYHLEPVDDHLHHQRRHDAGDDLPARLVRATAVPGDTGWSGWYAGPDHSADDTSHHAADHSAHYSASDQRLAAKHVLTGYWQNFNNGATVQRISDVHAAYNLIAVAFADADPARPGAITFNLDSAGLGGYTVAQFKADIAAKQAAGKRVILSVGGQNGTISVGTPRPRPTSPTVP